MVGVAADRIGNAVIGHIYHDKQICASDRFLDHGLCLAGAKAGTGAFEKIRIFVIASIIQILLSADQFLCVVFPKFYNMAVYFFCQASAAF